jgi:HD-GYP domain-containing protein (c-di-GMP phosphodiesterase class II)
VGRGLIEIRCERGAEIVRMLGLPEATAEAVRNLDEHWDGLGHPRGLTGEAIPLLGRILCLAQTVDVFLCAYGLDAVTTMLMQRRRRWFDPDLVYHLAESLGDREFWESLRSDDVAALTARHEPPDRIFEATEERLDAVARAFARVIDAKSPWTARQSERVAGRSVAIAQALGLAPDAIRDLRRAALLHDIGMLGVSILILEKVEPLSGDEWEAVRRHPTITYEILGKVTAFKASADIAVCHHEHLDGTGYPRGLTAEYLSLPARILAVATRAEAMVADRAHGKGVSWSDMLAWLAPLAGRVIDQRCYGALCTLKPSM